MAIFEPLPYTLLSLPRYARIMGINPAHFAGGAGATYFPLSNCSDVWPRYSWQHADHTGHDDLATSIAGAEREIADVLGYWPAPVWIENEVHRYPRYHRRELYATGMINDRGQGLAVNADYGKFIQGGERAVTLVGTATTAALTLVFSDEDGDGFDETATITLPTSLTAACELKPYFAGEGGAQEWEIRPLRSVTITGGNVVIVLDSWLLLDPDILSAYPTTAGYPAINIETASNYVASVDVYREYNDYTASHGDVFWERIPSTSGVLCSICGGVGCEACSLYTQTICIHVRDTDASFLVPVTAEYSTDDGAWIQTSPSICRNPDQVRFNYYSGQQSNRYLRGLTCDPLDDTLARAIAYMATARLERGPCGCDQYVNLAMELRRDATITSSTAGDNYFTPESLLTNPFGTRVGEIRAYEMLRLTHKRVKMGVAI